MMKKVLSVVAAAGVVAALSVSAFAFDGPHTLNSNSPSKMEVFVTTLGEGLIADTTVADKNLSNGETAYQGVTLVEDGGEYLAELGEGMSITDTAKDPID